MSASDTRGYRRAAVLGGAGMLGLEIVRQLSAAGKEVRTLDLNPLPEPDGQGGRPGSVCGAVGCIQACNTHLEKKGTLKGGTKAEVD
jgi:nucleoside-diphosphate-sugar epimerase